MMVLREAINNEGKSYPDENDQKATKKRGKGKVQLANRDMNLYQLTIQHCANYTVSKKIDRGCHAMTPRQGVFREG